MTGRPVADVALRPMRWWDVEPVVALERELFGATAWSAEAFWSELAHPQTRWYAVALDPGAAAPSAPAAPGGRILGYAGLLVTGSEADVQTIAVRADAQGRGLGTTLLHALMDEAVRRGATSLLLEVRADNGPAIALYRREGFERIAVRRAYYQPGGVDAWVMRRRPLQ